MSSSNSSNALPVFDGLDSLTLLGDWSKSSLGFSSALSSGSLDVSPVESAVISGVTSDSDSSGKSSTILTGAGGGACAGFILKFAAFADNTRQNVTLRFDTYTSIPTGFSDCDGAGASVTIKDNVGKSYTGRVILSTAVSNTAGVTFAIASSGLNFSSP